MKVISGQGFAGPPLSGGTPNPSDGHGTQDCYPPPVSAMISGEAGRTL